MCIKFTQLTYEQTRRFKCVYLTYQSTVDWTVQQDIMRCNQDFHGQPRYDCVIINDDAPGITISRLRDLIRCWLPSGRVVDLAVMHCFSPSKWKPKTPWKGCRVVEEDKSSSFMLMEYVTRGGLVCPVSDREGELRNFIVDSVDSDMFLRVNGWE